MTLILLIIAWLIVSFPIAILIGNCVFAGYGETHSGDIHE